MENGNITCDDVISKLKDDGDFDKLRIKIIRKIKENEELRNSIVSIVKESVAINRPGVENTKVRQLSDAIHHEVGSVS
ncbi:hypothetical protein HanPI659440_Chr00c28g0736861 [Helianthus annuus]|nr:hypothetical protein HanPI659440_Chr00c28g0736861 [Helianthus annuus]